MIICLASVFLALAARGRDACSFYGLSKRTILHLFGPPDDVTSVEDRHGHVAEILFYRDDTFFRFSAGEPVVTCGRYHGVPISDPSAVAKGTKPAGTGGVR